MNKQEAEERIEKLKKAINHHRYLYHVLDKQEISDFALDSLKKELFDLEQQFPEFITSDSPTQRVGGEPLKEFKKVSHSVLMLSFEDAFSQEDMKNWKERIAKFLKNLPGGKQKAEKIDFYCEPKIDGLAVELIYNNGILQIGSTRGDGKIGEDITQNLKTIEAIPLKLETPQPQVVVRGEVFISKKEFERINKERKKQKSSVYANPRNLAAGSVRQLDPKITASRKLDFFAYDIILDVKTHEKKHRILKNLGFKVNPYNKYCQNLKEVFDYYEHIQKIREKILYEIDGIVVIVNPINLFNKLGVVGKAPRGAIAFKFPGREATTLVEDIKVQVGRTGALTPVAYLKPVKVGGALISRATLHNEDEIKRLGIKIGDTVIVGRAGDVIPDIKKALKDLRTGKEKEFHMPLKCPFCASRIIRSKGEAVHRCVNPNCSAQRREYFYHFVSKQAFDIEGLGPKIIDQLIERGLVLDPADLFSLELGDIIDLESLPNRKPKSFLRGFAEKSANNLIEAISMGKEISLPRFIYSLGIRNVGEETAIDLAEHFSRLENLQRASKEELESIKDIGPVVADSIYKWFKDKANQKVLEKLKNNIKIKNYESRIKDSKLKNKTFVFTGEISSLTRDEAKNKVRELGGNVSELVSSKTDYLVIGENPGSKYDKAKKLGVKIIDEKTFLKML